MKLQFLTYRQYFELYAWQFVVLMIFLAFTGKMSVGQTSNNSQFQILKPNQPIERETTGGQIHLYKFDLQKGEFFQVRVEQKGTDVILKLSDADGNILATMDSPNGAEGPETLSYIAARNSTYLLQVSVGEENAQKGIYIIKRETSRTANKRDRRRVEIENLFANGMRVLYSEEQNKKTIQKLEQALAGWRELKDEYLTSLTENQIKRLKEVEQNNLDVLPLEIAQTVEKEANKIGIQFYSIKLKKGQVLRVDAREKGVDLKIGLINPENQIVAVSDLGSGYGREILTTLIEKAGNYFVSVNMSPSNSNGSYQLTANLREVAAINDNEQIRGEQLLRDGLANHRKEDIEGINNAITNWNEALPIWKKLDEKYWEYYTLNLLGRTFFDLSRLQEALKIYNQALMLATSVDEKSAQATTLKNIGDVYHVLGQQQKALDNYERALSITRTISDKRIEVAALTNIGWLYSLTGNKQIALKHFNEALKLVVITNDKSSQATILNNIGIVYNDLGDKQKALDYINQSLPLYKAGEDKRGEAAVLNNIGMIYSSLGEWQKALDSYNQSLPIVRAIGNKSGEAATLNNIGKIYNKLWENQKALEYYSQALMLTKDVGDISGEATILNNIGGVYDDLGDKQKALKSYNQALLSTKAIGDKSTEATILNNIGRVYDTLGEKWKALEFYNQSLSIVKTLGDKSSQAVTLNNLGEVYNDLDKSLEALKYFNQSLLLVRSAGDKIGEAKTLRNLMHTWKLLNNKRLAAFYGKLSVNQYQELRGGIRGFDYEIQKSFLRTVQETYRELNGLLIEEGRLYEAIKILDLYKDQQFFDYTYSSNSPIQQTPLTELEQRFSQQYRTGVDNISNLNEQIEILKQKIRSSQPNEQETAQLKRLELEYETAINNFLATLRVVEKEFTIPSPQAGTLIRNDIEMQIVLRNLEAQTRQKGVALYTLLESNKFYIIVVTSDSVKSFSSAIKADELNKKILQLYALLQSPLKDPKPISKELYDIILKPIEAELKNQDVKTLMWQLDGNLRYIPIAALFDGEKYFIEKYQNVVFTRSDKDRMTKDVNPIWTSGVGFGNSKGQEVNVIGTKISFPNLPGITQEIQSIFRDDKKETGILTSEIFINQQFTKTNFYRALRKHPSLVHISSHFSFQPADDLRSFLLLGDGGILTLNEMRQQKGLFEGVDLLVLSGCNTAAYQANEMETKIDGFAEVAQRLGANAVIATLWDRADASTATLMRAFYANRKMGLTKAEALRQAQLKLLNTTEKTNKPFAHPYYWAPFTLIGNWK